MKQAVIDTLNPADLKKLAVGYLLEHSEERPEGSEKIFDKLKKVEAGAKNLSNAAVQARQALTKLDIEFNQSVGSMKTLIDLVAEDITDEKAKELCLKYDPPPELGLGGQQLEKPASKIITPDMAGATSKHTKPHT